MVKGVECKLVDCSHNNDRRCAIDSNAEPLLEVMSFSGYCPEYDGTRFPFSFWMSAWRHQAAPEPSNVRRF